jgi:ABC-type uncharacterized transport system auxiliary subunit
MRLRRTALVLLGGLVAGCFHLSQPSPDIRDYRLDYPPPAITGEPLPVALRIAPLGVAAMYDRQPIVYGDDSYMGGTYYYARWSTNPGAMLTDLLVRDFVASHLYLAVQQGPAAVPNDYQLSGEVEDISEHTAAGDCAARLRLRTLLVRVRAGGTPLVKQTTYAADEPCACNDVRALAQAMSQAMERLSGQLQQAVYDAIAKDRAPS